MYLISPFRITTAQTNEFPRTLVMTSVDITVVIAMSANSYMIQGVSLDRETLMKRKQIIVLNTQMEKQFYFNQRLVKG